jgi:hypothetical protein
MDHHDEAVADRDNGTARGTVGLMEECRGETGMLHEKLLDIGCGQRGIEMPDPFGTSGIQTKHGHTPEKWTECAPHREIAPRQGQKKMDTAGAAIDAPVARVEPCSGRAFGEIRTRSRNAAVFRA